MKTYWTCRRATRPAGGGLGYRIALVTCEPGRAASFLQPGRPMFSGQVLPSELVPAWADLTARAAAYPPGEVWETEVDELPLTSKARGRLADRY